MDETKSVSSVGTEYAETPQAQIVNDVSNDSNTDSVNDPQITEDMVRSHPIYKALLDESVQRRKTIKELKTQLTQLESAESAASLNRSAKGEGETVDSQNDAINSNISDNNTPANDDPIVALRQELAQLKAALTERDAREQVRMQRESALESQQLSKDLLPLVNGTTPDEIQAQVAALAKVVGPNVPRDNSDVGASEQSFDSVRTRVLEKVLGNRGKGGEPNANSIYDPRFTARHGGGVINRS